jgi:hypothetical protein
MHVIPALRRLRQEVHEFEAAWTTEKYCLKQNNNQKKVFTFIEQYRTVN